MKSRGSTVGFAVLWLGLAQPTAAQTTGDPLRLLFECRQASELAFRVTIQNVSAAPAAAVIGRILANDKKYLPDQLELTVRRAGVPEIKLKYIDPTQTGVAGRLDPWLIALPPDASYSVVVPAQNFRLTPNLSKEPFSTPADLQLGLTTREVGRLNGDVQGLSFIHVWIGTLTSDWIRFPNQCGRNQPWRGGAGGG
jgi:hypothetical protein